MERALVLVKHAEPVIEPSVPPNRWRLSGEGRRRSALLGEWLARHRPGAVFSSEEPKAAETAGTAAVRLNVEAVTVPDLHEHDRTGAPFLRTKEEFERAAKTFFERPDELVWGNETAAQAGERFAGAIQTLLRGCERQNLAVVAHGTVISLFVARHNDTDPYVLWRSLGLPSLCVLTLPAFELRQVVHQLVEET